MVTLYGITNCSTVAKTRNWLELNNVQYNFHNYKKLGIDTQHLQQWCSKFGWEKVLNRQGMMFRKASQEDKDKVIDQASAIEFMLKVPNSIKRPIIELESNFIALGFDEQQYATIFKL